MAIILKLFFLQSLSGTIDGDLEHYTTVATAPQTIDYQSNRGNLGINMGVSYFLK